MLYTTYLALIYLITASFYLLNTFTHFPQPAPTVPVSHLYLFFGKMPIFLCLLAIYSIQVVYFCCIKE